MFHRVKNEPSLFPSLEQSATLIQMTKRGLSNWILICKLIKIPHKCVRVLPFVSSMFGHIAVKLVEQMLIRCLSSICTVLRCNTSVVTLRSNYCRLTTFNRLVFCTILWNGIRAFVVVCISTIRASATFQRKCYFKLLSAWKCNEITYRNPVHIGPHKTPSQWLQWVGVV